MMTSLRPLVALAPLLSLVVACGGSSSSGLTGTGGGTGGVAGGDGGSGRDAGPGTGGGASAVKLADLPAKVAEAACTVTETCLGPVTQPGVDCVETTRQKIAEGEFSLFQSAIDAKRISYDGTKVTACTDALKKAGCDLLTQRIASLCADVIQGTVDGGGTCSLNAECRKGLFCERAKAGPGGAIEASCPGKCTELLASGQPCATSDECKDGLVCSHSKCAEPVKEGAACSKDTGPDCLPNLACVGTPGTCKAFDAVLSGAEGAACDLGGTLCKSGLVCAIVGVDAAGKLKTLCEKPASGQKCHVGFPESCPTGQFCELPAGTVDGLCKILPGDGEACAKQIPSDAKSPATLCRAGTVCDAPGGTCKTVGKDGAACASAAECLSGICAAGACAATACPG
jgi:hypothetical protein